MLALHLPLSPHFTPGQNPCARCKVFYGATCCERKTGDGPRFPMTYSEAKCIADYAQQDIVEAVDVKTVSEAQQEELFNVAGPDAASLVVDNVGLYLPTTEHGDCRYLQPDVGCTIPNYKPYFCAVFPFSTGPYGEWRIGEIVQQSGYCFGQDVSPMLSDAITVFDTSTAMLDKLHTRNRRDRKTHAALLRQWLWR